MFASKPNNTNKLGKTSKMSIKNLNYGQSVRVNKCGKLAKVKNLDKLTVLKYYSNNLVNPSINIPVEAGLTEASYPWGIAYDGKNMWVADSSSFTNYTYKIDGHTRKILENVVTGPFCITCTFDGTYMWVTSLGIESTVSPGTFDVPPQITKVNVGDSSDIVIMTVDDIPDLLAPFGAAFDGRYMWVANHGTTVEGSNLLLKIDPITNKQVDKIALSQPYPEFVGYDGKNIWVTSYGAYTLTPEPFGQGDLLTKINPQTGEILAEITTPKGPCEVLFDGKDIWVACYSSDSVIRVDVNENKIKSIITNDLSNPAGLIYDGRYIWTGNFDSYAGTTVAKIDPCVNKVVELVPTGTDIEVQPPAPLALAFDGIDVWVVNDGNASITLI